MINSRSVSEGSNLSPAAPQRSRFAGLFLLSADFGPARAHVDPRWVMVKMMKPWSSLYAGEVRGSGRVDLEAVSSAGVALPNRYRRVAVPLRSAFKL